MAAKTPDTIVRESVGSLTLLMCQFSTTNIDEADTYASGLGSNLVDAWFQSSLNNTTGSSVRVVNSSGTITFHSSEDNHTGTLFVLAKT